MGLAQELERRVPGSGGARQEELAGDGDPVGQQDRDLGRGIRGIGNTDGVDEVAALQPSVELRARSVGDEDGELRVSCARTSPDQSQRGTEADRDGDLWLVAP